MYSPLQGNSTLKVRQYKPGPTVLPTLLLLLLLLVVLGSGLLPCSLLMSWAVLLLLLVALLLLTASTVWRRELHPEVLGAAAAVPAASAVRRLCSWLLLLLLYRTPATCEAPQPLIDLAGAFLFKVFLLAAALCLLLGLGLLLRPCLLLLAFS
jgi:hypothetical protein